MAEPIFIDAAKAFNITRTSENDPLIDQSTQVRVALSAMGDADEGEQFTFPPGIFACEDLDLVKAPIVGCGPRRTMFANLSPSNRLFEMQPQITPGWAGAGSAFFGIKGISIDQRMSAGSAIKLSTQFNYIHDVMIKDQGGGRYGQFAVSINQGTLADLRNLHILNSDNGLEVTNTHYVRGDNISIERQDGRALRMVSCPRGLFHGLYTDNGNVRSAGKLVPDLVYAENCNSLRFYGFDAEYDNAGSLDATQMTAEGMKKAFNRFLNCMNVTIHGFGISHKTTNHSPFIFFFQGGGATLSSGEWNEQKSAVVFARGDNTLKRISVENVDAYNVATGSRNGVGMFYGKASGASVTVRNWVDHGQPVAHFL